jgi:hypothetical protein
MLGITLLLYHITASLCLSVLFATLLLLVAQVVNLYGKSSLHVSLNIYIAFLLMTINFKMGLLLFLFTGLLGWSRVALGRHTLREAELVGSVAIITSLLMLYTEGDLKTPLL